MERKGRLEEYYSIFKDVFSNKNIMAISVTVALWGMMGQGYRPFWALYLQNYLGASITDIGIFSMIATAESLLFQLPGGLIADRYGRRKLILAGTVFRTLGPVFYLMAPSWEWVIPGAMVAGMTSLYMPAFNAIIAESLPSERRGSGYGVYNTITRIPSIIAPLLGGLLVDTYGLYRGVRVFLMLQIGASILGIIIRFFNLKETVVHRTGKRPPILPKAQTFKELPRPIFIMIIVSIIGSFSGRLVFDYINLYALDIIKITPTNLGIITSIAGLVQMVLTLPSGILSDKYGRKNNIMVSRVIAPVTQYFMTSVSGFTPYMLVMSVNAVGLAFGGGGVRAGGSAWNALIADIVPSHKRATVNGVIGTLTAVVAAPSSVLGGWLWETFYPQLPFQLSAVIGLVAAAVFWFGVHEPEKVFE
ncbi:MAG: MFS transporter [Candidatus Bathyarchaeota archaeon]|nr:MFS transporter [Candidatus Bathyarchaeota archaeon]